MDRNASSCIVNSPDGLHDHVFRIIQPLNICCQWPVENELDPASTTLDLLDRCLNKILRPESASASRNILLPELESGLRAARVEVLRRENWHREHPRLSLRLLQRAFHAPS